MSVMMWCVRGFCRHRKTQEGTRSKRPLFPNTNSHRWRKPLPPRRVSLVSRNTHTREAGCRVAGPINPINLAGTLSNSPSLLRIQQLTQRRLPLSRERGRGSSSAALLHAKLASSCILPSRPSRPPGPCHFAVPPSLVPPLTAAACAQSLLLWHPQWSVLCACAFPRVAPHETAQ